MTPTLFHIIIPPVIASVCIVLIILIFRRSHKRCVSAPGDAATQQNAAEVTETPDGAVAVGITRVPGDTVALPTKVQKQLSEEPSADEQIAEREKMLIKRIAANPRDVEAYDLLGQVYLVQGNLTDAAECFSQVVVFDPRNLRAVEQLNKIKKITRHTQENADA